MNKSKANSGISGSANARRVARACSAIIPLCFFSLLIALFLAFCANDIYAFVKPAGEVKIELVGAHSVREVAKELEDSGVIENPALFCAYVRSKGADDKITSARGVIALDASMSYREIVKIFVKNASE